jgi:lipopolysaccharide biosynthesis glycosyltransferase
MNKKTIPIFFTFDENYAPYFSVALASLIDHTSKENDYTINVVYSNISDETKEKIASLGKDNVHLTFTDIDDKIGPIAAKLNNQSSKTHFPISVYFRLFLPSMFPEFDKGIYVDSDTCFNADVAEFYNYDLEDKLIGAIKDISISQIAPFIEYIENAVGIKGDMYVNSGVLLMNMKKLREIDFENHFLYILSKYDFEIVAPDQDYLNALLKDQIKYLPVEWNAMPIEGVKGVDNPKLIHYNLFLKPWHYSGIAYEEYFWKYAEKSLFKDKIYAEKEAFTEDRKAMDDAQLQVMLKQAKAIQANEYTFKKVFESGQEKRLNI